MLFLIEVDIDYARMGSNHDRILREQWTKTKELYDNGIILRIWVKANARGAVAVWSVPDPESLRNYIRNIPLYPYITDVKVTPLVAHPEFPQFAKKND